MPIITFVIGYIYLIFGSFNTFRNVGVGLFFSFILTSVLATIGLWHHIRIAKATSGNLVCPTTFALQMLLTHFSMIVVIAAIIAIQWISSTLVTQSISFVSFAFFGFLLNIGAGTFPTFSVADPFYWNQNRTISPSYDRALKSVLLAILSYFCAYFSFLWHSIVTMMLIFLDVVLMAHYWEIAGFEDLGEKMRHEREDNQIQEDIVVEDLHMD